MGCASRMTRSTARAIKAFSLIELVVVLVILSVLAAVAAPRFLSAQERFRADAAAKRIAADIDLAREQARAASASRTITFDKTTHTVTIANVAGLNSTTSTYTVKLAAEPYYAKITKVSFAGSSSLTFDGYGQPNASGSVIVKAGATQRTITYSTTTAQVVIQ